MVKKERIKERFPSGKQAFALFLYFTICGFSLSLSKKRRLGEKYKIQGFSKDV